MRGLGFLTGVIAAWIGLGVAMDLPRARAAECPASGKALGDAWGEDYLPPAAADIRSRGGSDLSELAQWYGYALGLAMSRAAPGSRTQACLRALDRHIQSQVKLGALHKRYVAGYIGAPPAGRLAEVTQPDKLVALLDTLIRERAVGEVETGADGGLVGTWDLVDWVWLRNGEPIPNVRFEYVANGWVMELRPGGRLIVEGSVVADLLQGDSGGAGAKVRGAWLAGSDGRALTLKMGETHLNRCPIVEHTKDFLRFRCHSGESNGDRYEHLFKFQRLAQP